MVSELLFIALVRSTCCEFLPSAAYAGGGELSHQLLRFFQDLDFLSLYRINIYLHNYLIEVPPNYLRKVNGRTVVITALKRADLLRLNFKITAKPCLKFRDEYALVARFGGYGCCELRDCS